LAYADIGFMGAAFKFACECIPLNKREEEIRIIGFAAFVLILFIAACEVLFIILGISPGLLIKDINTVQEQQIASQLFFILALFSPLMVINRICSTIFGIRLEDYTYGKMELAINLMRIVSVFYFLNGSRYDIVGFYLFYQFVAFITLIVSLLIIWKKYKYDLKLLFKAIRFDSEIYTKLKKLAFNNLFISIMGILFFEIDLAVIGPLAGKDPAAIFAIGITVFTFMRNIINIVTSPFLAKFNYYISLKDLEGLKKSLASVMIFIMPLIAYSIISLELFMRPFIMTWVGDAYESSIIITQLLIFGFIFHFITQPAFFMLYSQEKTRQLYKLYTSQAIIYWIGIALTWSFFGLFSFALFKFIILSIGAVFYLRHILKFLGITLGGFSKRFLSPLIIPVFLLCLAAFFESSFLSLEKGTIYLLMTLIAISLTFCLGLGIHFIICKDFRKMSLSFLQELFPFIFKGNRQNKRTAEASQ
jgi:O-antigen/teichoic acid export membrane protein